MHIKSKPSRARETDRGDEGDAIPRVCNSKRTHSIVREHILSFRAREENRSGEVREHIL